MSSLTIVALHTLCIRLTTSTRYFPRGGGRDGGMLKALQHIPLAVSITQPACSIYISLVSACVWGCGLCTMLSNNLNKEVVTMSTVGGGAKHSGRLTCVAIMTGYPGLLQRLTILLWAKNMHLLKVCPGPLCHHNPWQCHHWPSRCHQSFVRTLHSKRQHTIEGCK